MSIFRFCLCGWLAGFRFVALLAPMPPASPDAHFKFSEPRQTSYRVEQSQLSARSTIARAEWVTAWPENGSRYPVEFGSRVVLQLRPGTDIQQILGAGPLKLARTVAADFFILQAADAPTAMSEMAAVINGAPALISGDTTIACP